MSLDELRRSFLIIIEPLQNYVFDFWVEKGNIIEGIPEDIRFDLRHVSVTVVIVIYTKLLSILLLIDEKNFWWWLNHNKNGRLEMRRKNGRISLTNDTS